MKLIRGKKQSNNPKVEPDSISKSQAKERQEKLVGEDGKDYSLKNCKSLRRAGGSRMVIYGGGSDSEENQVKFEVHINREAQGKEHLEMVLQKFDWTECLAVAIPVKVIKGSVVNIVDT